ncbi:MAG: bis-aminopropyl spermidine synthase family protein [Frankia sp.]|nr:bis-aminopropyl spermidine synthase family protein [Frankia sp.]
MGVTFGEDAFAPGSPSPRTGPGVHPTEPTSPAEPAAAEPRAQPTPPGAARLAELLAGYGAYARPVRALVARLVAPPAPGTAGRPGAPLGQAAVGRLVREHGLARRTVEEVLAALGDDVEDDPLAGPRVRPDRVAGYQRLAGAGWLPPATAAAATAAWPGLPGDGLAVRADQVATMRELIAAAPRPRADLDHVPATAETVARRAQWLGAAYDLAGRTLLCLGDHDLTSLAAAAAIPGLGVVVVDVDDDLLAFLDEQASARGLAIRCYFADLRFGLPPAVAGTADLAFTDPPYTPAGVALFCARGAEGLRDREHGRVLLAYGFSDRTPTLGWKAQRALGDAGFAIEALLPAFHAYDGAEAIGARAGLYVCRPTQHTWRLLERAASGHGGLLAAAGTAAREGDERTAIYTRGRGAEESAPRQLPQPAARALLSAAAAATARPDGPGQLVLVGDLPADAAPAAEHADKDKKDKDEKKVATAHVLLPTVLAGGLPPAARAHPPVAVAADLTDDPGGWLPRLLLATNADALAAAVRADHPADLTGLLAAVAPKWTPAGEAGAERLPGRLRILAFATTDPDTLAPAARLRRWLLDRAHGRIGNVWREGLIRHARQAHAVTLTRRAALAVAEAALAGVTGWGGRDPLGLLQARLVDLPTAALAGLLAAVDRSAAPGGPGWPGEAAEEAQPVPALSLKHI